MPGDPLRAKFIAETYLEDVVKFNAVRNMFVILVLIKEKVSVMGSGMECLVLEFTHMNYLVYGVENIIRVGSAGA